MFRLLLNVHERHEKHENFYSLAEHSATLHAEGAGANLMAVKQRVGPLAVFFGINGYISPSIAFRAFGVFRGRL